MTRDELYDHHCKPGSTWDEYDAQGIYLCKVCSKCERAKLATYRPEILTGYTQADVDEPIEPEECYAPAEHFEEGDY